MTQRFFDCSVPGCRRPSARSVGAGCDVCRRHFCGSHLLPEFHQCNAADLDDAAYHELMVAEITRLRARINEGAVCRLASSLNGGKACVLEHPTEFVGPGALTGCANYHIRIVFGDDGSASWLLRVPRLTGFAVGLPVGLAEYLVRSEFATLRFLETTAVPAPRAFSFGIPSQGTDHDVGVCFLLIEELAGKPWDGRGNAMKVWQGLGAILAELGRHRFRQAGSLCVESPDDQPLVSAAASDRFLCLDPWGPFRNSADYYSSWAEQYLALIADGQLYTQFPVEAYLVYNLLKDKATKLSDDSHGFFLKHVDDKGDHILIDDDYNITGVIDWQMARVVPPGEAFGLSLVSADMGALCNGLVSIGAQDVALREALREKSAELASYCEDEKHRRFFWGLGLEADWDQALPLANAILQIFGEGDAWDEWKQQRLSCNDDERLVAILATISH